MKKHLCIALLVAPIACAEELKNTLALEDVFSLEYASNLEVSAKGDEIYFVRNYMDIQTDKKFL